MKLVTLLFLGLCFTTCAGAQEKSKSEKKKTPVAKTVSRKQLEAWINQLSEGDFLERRTASNNLLKAGKQALPALVKGAQRNNAELSARSVDIIGKMYRGKNKTLKSSALKALSELGISFNRSVAQRATNVIQQKLQEDAIAAIAAIKKMGGSVTLDKSGKAESVRIAGTINTDAVRVHLRRLTSLQKLYLERTNFSDADLVYLKGMAKLQRLELSKTQITDAGLVHLKGLASLQALYLNRTKVTDAGLVHLKGLTNLQVLYLHGTQVTDAGLVHLKGMTILEWLKLDKTLVTDAGLVHLKMLTNLKSLSLYRTQVTYAGLKELKAALPKCSIWWK